METTKNILPENISIFFKELSDYLDTKLLFYGSVQRNDYFPGNSDIDVDIFTDNEDSIIVKLQHFLHVKHNNFKKIVWRLSDSKKLIYGHKIMYKNSDMNLAVEFSIYNERNKQDVLKHHLKKIVLPFYASWFLMIIKKLFYDFHIINFETYKFLKSKMLSFGIGYPEEQFIVLDKK